MYSEEIELPDGKTAVFKMDSLTPEDGKVPLQRWGMIGAQHTSVATLTLAGGEKIVHMNFIPREIILDGLETVYAEDKRYQGVIIGGLKTSSDHQNKGYGTTFLLKVIERLKETKEAELIFNFVLDEKIDYFLSRGWEEVDRDEVRVTVQQPSPSGNVTVPLPDKFHFVMFPLNDKVEMPEATVEIMGLPA